MGDSRHPVEATPRPGRFPACEIASMPCQSGRRAYASTFVRPPRAFSEANGSGGTVSKRDYYEVLGVSRDADEAELKSCYRKLALKFHPDRNPDDPVAEEKFKEASEAYAVLSDSAKRQRYNQFGFAGVAGAASGGGRRLR